MSRSASERRRIVAALSLALWAGGCRLFVDLDGLGDGVAPTAEASADATPGDAAETGDAALDAGREAAPAPDAGIDDAGCPTGRGPAMVRIRAGATTFCMDGTEVTNEQYLAFVATLPDGGGLPPRCAGTTSLLPKQEWPKPTALAKRPVVWVDWCDAYAFCQWAGKRLCGRVGGGDLAPGDADDPAVSEMVFACTAAGTRVYPYGSTYNPTACNGDDSMLGQLLDVGALPACEGGFPGLFDLSGSVHEWVDSCASSTVDGGTVTDCHTQNSSFLHAAQDMPCASMAPLDIRTTQNELGFRCCAD